MSGPCAQTFNSLPVPAGNLDVINLLCFSFLVAVTYLCRNVFRPLVDPKQDKSNKRLTVNETLGWQISRKNWSNIWHPGNIFSLLIETVPATTFPSLLHMNACVKYGFAASWSLWKSLSVVSVPCLVCEVSWRSQQPALGNSISEMI